VGIGLKVTWEASKGVYVEERARNSLKIKLSRFCKQRGHNFPRGHEGLDEVSG
jgi:hypothetical protein